MLQLPYAKIQEIVLLPTAISERNNISKHLYNISTIFKSKTTVKYSYNGGNIIHKLFFVCPNLSQYIEYKSDYIKIVII